MKPMLAHRFNDHKDKIKYPVWIQPKLNGVRGLYAGGQFQSRDEFLWKPEVLKHLTDELSKVVDNYMVLDGELYVHGWSLQKINGAIQVNRKEANKLTPQVEYHVFDIIDTSQPDLCFSARAELLQALQDRIHFRRVNKIKVATTVKAGEAFAEASYALYKKEGYEGLMYRDPMAPYGFSQRCGNQENRWKYLLKRKSWQDDEFSIVDFNITEGSKGHRGFQLTCATKGGQLFNVGSGLDISEMSEYEQEPPIGKLARVRYEMLSDAGIPLKPTLEAVL